MNKTLLKRHVLTGASIAKIAAEFECAKTTVRYWLRKYGFRTLRKPRQVYLDSTKSCLVCKKLKTKKWLCAGCYTKVRRYRQKLKAVALLGGRCERCGWTGNIAGFEFHHRESDNKQVTIGNVANKSWAVIKKELKKCELLCSCCHRIEHSNNEAPAFRAAVLKYQGLAPT